MKTAKSIIVVLFVLLTAQIASAYYCPSNGRWLSRDPIGEPGFQTLRDANTLPQFNRTGSLRPARWIQRDSDESIKEPNRYIFVKNDPKSKIDALGLLSLPGGNSTTFTWTASPCGSGYQNAFIQVGLGGSVLYNSPFVDDGKHGPASDKPNCPPLYPSSSGNYFEDTAGNRLGKTWGLSGLQFEVCRVCLKPCCGGYQIASVGPCRVYTLPGNGGTEDLDDPGVSTSFNGSSGAFNQAMNSSYPGALKGGCIKCANPN